MPSTQVALFTDLCVRGFAVLRQQARQLLGMVSMLAGFLPDGECSSKPVEYTARALYWDIDAEDALSAQSKFRAYVESSVQASWRKQAVPSCRAPHNTRTITDQAFPPRSATQPNPRVLATRNTNSVNQTNTAEQGPLLKRAPALLGSSDENVHRSPEPRCAQAKKVQGRRSVGGQSIHGFRTVCESCSGLYISVSGKTSQCKSCRYATQQ